MRVRDLINTPTEQMGPDELEAVAREIAANHGADIDVLSGDALLAHNFPAIHAVGRASHRAPRLIVLRWGASDEEVARPFPDAKVVPSASRSATMAVTIDAPPLKVWPWLVQMGVDRGGWYSWDRLENFGRKSSEVIHPEREQRAAA